MSITRIYVVGSTTGNDPIDLVRATSKAQALGAVCPVRVATQDDLVKYLAEDYEIVDATVDADPVERTKENEAADAMERG